MHSITSEAAVRKAAFYVGLAALGVGMGMAFEYGRAMSMLHAISLGLLAIAVSIAFIGAEMYRKAGRTMAAMIATAAGIAFSAGEYGTHFGYTVGTRVAETQQTGVTNAAYKARQDNKDREAANLDLWRKQLAELTSAAPWAATVKADALRAQVDAMDKSIELETARGGCKVKCQKLMVDKGSLMERIGKIEQANDLNRRIEATQRLLDQKVDVAVKQEFHSSKIVNQTAGFAQIATWSDTPSDSALSWTQLILGAIIAAITTYLAPFCMSVAFSGMPRREGEKYELEKPLYRSGSPSLPSVIGIPQTNHTHTREVRTENPLAAKSLADIRRLIESRHGVTA